MEIMIQVLLWPESVNELIVEWAEENNIDPSRIEIRNADEILVH